MSDNSTPNQPDNAQLVHRLEALEKALGIVAPVTLDPPDGASAVTGNRYIKSVANGQDEVPEAQKGIQNDVTHDADGIGAPTRSSKKQAMKSTKDVAATDEEPKGVSKGKPNTGTTNVSGGTDMQFG